MDYAGPFRGKMFLLLIDAHSKWPEIFEMASSSSESTIAMLRRVFAAYSLPEHLVSDNGSKFTYLSIMGYALLLTFLAHVYSVTLHYAGLVLYNVCLRMLS